MYAFIALKLRIASTSSERVFFKYTLRLTLYDKIQHKWSRHVNYN